MSNVKTTTISPLDIEVINRTNISHDKLSVSELIKTIRRLNVIFGYVPDQSIEIILTTPNRIQSINLKFRHKNRPTDVLSFPQHYHEKFPENILGTIVLCPNVIKQQEGKYVLLPYLIHGYLHLMGYDHEGQSDQKEWNKIMKQIFLLLD